MNSQLAVPVMFVILFLFLAIVFFAASLVARVKEKIRGDQAAIRKMLLPVKAKFNALKALNILLQFLIERQSVTPSSPFWPTTEQLREYLLDYSWLLENPMSEQQEPILVFENCPTGPVLAGRTIICLVKPGKAVVQCRDEDGVQVLFETGLDPFVEVCFNAKKALAG